ncbi:MmgE/PrpD family protein [Rhodopila sp.]|jgi:2-methylcitrate dehydratase PrpD|uniref:MmgE/PrpD family protein n=1 Tax=Rhodopila sp. TaxID=2480087 RepID=UPI002BE3AA28|nr:MmgE/PrpD family protein [Rhodopila sp.]HVZ09535.1 MmgE/PrpD family protein [Rhodopila sp.]
MTTLTKHLGRFVADLSPNRLPDEATRIARMGFIDTIGTMIAGRDEDCVRILTETLAPGDGPATLTFTDRKAPAPDAAWINGTAAHALDYDDVALRGHPSTVLVPAILAEAEHLGSSGADMITAYIAGYEVWAELFVRDSGLLHQKGWHPTGLYGAVGAAAACAKLRKLDAEKSAIAIALGASQAAGIMSNFGTMTKPFHAGKSAHAGIMAARLAEAGFTANTDALEHPQGFLHAISPTGTEDRTSEPKAGQEWAILKQGLGIKKYPTCYCTHRAIDCMLDLVQASPIKAEQVDKITVNISDYFSTVLRNHQPETGLAAKFSMEFCMASGIVAQRVGLRELTDAFVQRPDIQALMRKVEIVTTTEHDPELPGAAPQDQVTVRLLDGRTIAGTPVARATGHPTRPLTDRQIFEKFADCLDVGHSSIPAETLFNRLSALQSITARELTAQA